MFNVGMCERDRLGAYFGEHHTEEDYSPHKAAHKISELNLFLYLRISGVSGEPSCPVGVTLTLTWLSRRDAFPPEPAVPPLPVEPAPKPNVRNERCFCCKGRN